MKKAIAALLLLTSCSTSEVTSACNDVHTLASSPLFDVAPGEVKLAAVAIRLGAYACGTPEYAQARERILSWVRAK